MSNLILTKNLSIVHAVNFELLCAFDEMCREANLVYSLAGGTLLGAVRHQGFIPWDDDVDLFMLRPDYEKFLKYYDDKQLKNPHYHLIHINAGAPGLPFARLVDDRTIIKSKSSKMFSNLWIDILPLDGVPETIEERRELGKHLRKLRRKRLLANAPAFTGKTKLRAILKTPIAFLLRKLGIQKIIIKKIIKESQAIPFESATRVGELVAQAKVKGTIQKDTFHNYTLINFEGKKFMAMPDYEQYLRETYGNYMRLPPRKKRRGHAIEVYMDVDAFDDDIKEMILNNKIN